MAPEQLEGKEADARSDIWALGCVLYEMATGRRAFEGASQAILIARDHRTRARAGRPIAPSSAAALARRRALERLVRACLAKDPEERIQTAHDVKLQLQGIAEGAGYSTGGMPICGASRRPACARAAPARRARRRAAPARRRARRRRGRGAGRRSRGSRSRPQPAGLPPIRLPASIRRPARRRLLAAHLARRR